ncbi:MAG: hypothetical protein AAF829_07530 [Pseudomonadota bacterium]
MTRFSKPLLAGFSLCALSACGLQGDLTRPDPLFGNPSQLEPAEPLDRQITDGLDDLQESRRSGDDSDNPPDAEDELLGGPDGR